jgi:hypothetical protein
VRHLILSWHGTGSGGPETNRAAHQQAAADAVASSPPARDYIGEARRDAEFNCAVLRDAVNDYNKAVANAQRYGGHESLSQAMEMDRAQSTLSNCP